MQVRRWGSVVWCVYAYAVGVDCGAWTVYVHATTTTTTTTTTSATAVMTLPDTSLTQEIER